VNDIQISEVAIIWLRILNVQANHHQETDENVGKVHEAIHKGRWYMVVFVTF
jgi:hypothetical protein